MLINALSALMIPINLNTMFYTHGENSPTKTVYISYHMETHTHTHKHTHTHTMTVVEEEKESSHVRNGPDQRLLTLSLLASYCLKAEH